MNEESLSFEAVIIGAGPAGYVTAIRLAQLGLKTALVEKNAHLGGTCLNVGCIPSKALLHSTEVFHFMKEKGAEHGIIAGSLKADIGALMKKKTAVVDRLRQGVRQLVEKRGITIIAGQASFIGPDSLQVDDGKKKTVLKAKHTVIATGSSVVELPFLKFDGKTVVSSDEAIAFDKPPAKLVVVGAGAIGLELGSVWSRLGSEVTVVEMLPQIAPTFDKDIASQLQRVFTRQGLRFELGVKVTGIEEEKKQTFLTAEKNGKPMRFEADKILVAVGRKPNTAGLALDKAGIKLDEKGRIPTDDHFRTSVKGIYAIGDVIAGPMLAHKAEDEGVACAEIIAGKGGHVNYDAIPNVIYTDPEVASVGLGEEEAKKKGLEISIGKAPLAANGRAIASDSTDGLVKVIADAKTDRLLGVQIVAHNASELIAAAVTHMEYGGSAEDLARTVTAHPTLGESLKEAAMAVDKRAIHAL